MENNYNLIFFKKKIRRLARKYNSQISFIEQNIVPSILYGLGFAIIHKIFVDFIRINYSFFVRAISVAFLASFFISRLSSNKGLNKYTSRRTKQILESIKEGVIEIDTGGKHTLVNPAAVEMLGYKNEEDLIGLPSHSTWHHTRVDGSNYPPEDCCIYSVLTSGKELSLSSEVFWRKDGTCFPVEYSVSPLCRNEKITGIVVIFRDISDRIREHKCLVEKEQKYRELSVIDDLTGLWNVRYFWEKLKSEVEMIKAHNQQLALLLLDIDDFKKFNDTYGHLEGDNVLTKFGKILKNSTRGNDSPFRYGGEEFVIILPMTNIDQALIVAEKIKVTTSNEVIKTSSGASASLTVSIGIAVYENGEELSNFVNRADQLMYRAKETGKNRICYGE